MAFTPYKDLKKNGLRLRFGDDMRMHSATKDGIYTVENAAAGAWAKIVDDEYRVVLPLKHYFALLNTDNIVQFFQAPIFQLTFWVVSPSQPPFVCVHENGKIMSTPEAGERFVEEVLEAGPECSLHVALEYHGKIINSMPVIVLRKGADLRTEINQWGIKCSPTRKRSPKTNKAQSKRGSTKASTPAGSAAQSLEKSKPTTRSPRKQSVRTSKPTARS